MASKMIITALTGTVRTSHRFKDVESLWEFFSFHSKGWSIFFLFSYFVFDVLRRLKTSQGVVMVHTKYACTHSWITKANTGLVYRLDKPISLNALAKVTMKLCHSKSEIWEMLDAKVHLRRRAFVWSLSFALTYYRDSKEGSLSNQTPSRAFEGYKEIASNYLHLGWIFVLTQTNQL